MLLLTVIKTIQCNFVIEYFKMHILNLMTRLLMKSLKTSKIFVLVPYLDIGSFGDLLDVYVFTKFSFPFFCISKPEKAA